MREKLLIFPYSFEIIPLLNHYSLLDKFEIIGGITFGHKDNYCSFNKGKIDIQKMDKFKLLLECCDTVLICDNLLSIDYNEFIFSKILEAIKHKKNIISVMDIDDKRNDIISELCKEYGVHYQSCINREQKSYLIFKENLYRIGTPVVFVMGMGERTCKFEIQLSIREEIKRLGYKVAQVGSRKYCELMGFHSFPNFMFDKSISEAEKIISFNRFIKEIEIEESPDLIIIGIPGGTMKLNNEYTHNFGIIAYEVSQALTPDFVLVSSFYENYKPEYFKKISTALKYKFGYEIDCFNLSNVQCHWPNAGEFTELEYLTIDPSFIDKKLKNYKDLKIPLFNIFNSNDSKEIATSIIDKLSYYGEYSLFTN
ncbi:TIGR04066 family peptide maturation system protein [Ruminiclostridium cellobioparum]|jgi:peptide maturation system protein (TIGR04066 family)|uniref:TIGR04066 family peptide maturation system protein n=1 Tax=Ruminiclostridium cellobioparum TaxID=29355 RepID=UPI000484BD79|nr:TIGR04066 family peptide maturation system protein [Ruminiclostridium cellobioparum]